MTEPTYAERLRETIERKIRLRSVFTSRMLIEDNEREIRKAQLALRAAEGSRYHNGAEAAREFWCRLA